MITSVNQGEGLPQNKGFEGGQYKPLTDAQIRQIHEASLTILARTGVEVESPDVRRLFQDAGAVIEGSRVRFSTSMIEQAIERAPSRVFLAGRAARHDLTLEGKRVYAGTGGAALQVQDFDTGVIRNAQLRSLVDHPRQDGR